MNLDPGGKKVLDSRESENKRNTCFNGTGTCCWLVKNSLFQTGDKKHGRDRTGRCSLPYSASSPDGHAGGETSSPFPKKGLKVNI